MEEKVNKKIEPSDYQLLILFYENKHGLSSAKLSSSFLDKLGGWFNFGGLGTRRTAKSEFSGNLKNRLI